MRDSNNIIPVSLALLLHVIVFGSMIVAFDYARPTPFTPLAVKATLVQEVLELCRSVRDAVEYLRGRPRIGGALLMLADADGEIASVEVAPDQLAGIVHRERGQTESAGEREFGRAGMHARLTRVGPVPLHRLG